MPYLEVVEEGTKRAEKLLESNASQDLDPTNEQDNNDCQEEGEQDHPDFLFKDPSDFMEKSEVTKKETVYSKIELKNDKELDEMTLELDEEQKRVLEIGVNYAKNLVKAKNNKERITSSKVQNLVVQGGAGVGKSRVIEILTQRTEKMLRGQINPKGDNSNHPYIVKAAFTETAAANIKGQTMTSAFSFSFGNTFFSLTNKSRNEKRTVLENLAAVVIDEYSMIKSDMLYQLNLRLQEIKQNNKLFGGVALFFFGDILQLRPVMAKYIMEMPADDTFHIAYTLENL